MTRRTTTPIAGRCRRCRKTFPPNHSRRYLCKPCSSAMKERPLTPAEIDKRFTDGDIAFFNFSDTWVGRPTNE